jgi:Haem-NO-binding
VFASLYLFRPQASFATSLTEECHDENFDALVERACAAVDVERAAFLRDLGFFTASRTFAGLYPSLFALTPTTREFLLMVEQPIHELVRTAIPNALPPRLAISPLDEKDVAIVYSSERRLCELLCGLVEGTAAHYGEVAQLDESTCMHCGDQACTFQVRVARAAPLETGRLVDEARAPGMISP